ncbi:hypothetical protein [Largemouth bass virus]|nr:hypothetical protein [Mandarin fish ranavirus]WEI28977.1 hypothetical protein [Largemouth bass virus]WHA35544.1 hypothetical protein MSRaV_56L [Micropterus salmoides ranavirus]WHA35649.1 hypothetical protein SCRaV_56L [Siniperca chuatsi ranavirus]
MEKFIDRMVTKPDANQTEQILSGYGKVLIAPLIAYGASVAAAYIINNPPHMCSCGSALSEAARLGIFLGVLCALYNWMG